MKRSIVQMLYSISTNMPLLMRDQSKIRQSKEIPSSAKQKSVKHGDDMPKIRLDILLSLLT